MIVDTSALIAILLRESHWQALQRAFVDERCLLPAPALIEFKRLSNGRYRALRAEAAIMIAEALAANLALEPFTAADAHIADAAIPLHGKGSGGPLNFGDLLVYATARRTGLPILCTGRDFASTDIAIHPASRRD